LFQVGVSSAKNRIRLLLRAHPVAFGDGRRNADRSLPRAQTLERVQQTIDRRVLDRDRAVPRWTTGDDSQPERGFLHNINTVLLKLSILDVGNVAFVQKKLRAANQIRVIFNDRRRSRSTSLLVCNCKQNNVTL